MSCSNRDAIELQRGTDGSPVVVTTAQRPPRPRRARGNEQAATTKQRQLDSQNEPKAETAWQREERLYDEARDRQRDLVIEFNAIWHAQRDILKRACELRNEPVPPSDNDAYLAA